MVFLCAGLLGFTSCSDFLEPDSRSNVSADQYFKTATGYQELTTSVYYSLRAIYGDDPLMFSAGTDLYDDPSNKVDASFKNPKTMTSSNNSVKSFYKNCYAGIERVNCMEYYYSSNIADADKLLDEGRFIRAYYYYLLSQQFGGVPIKTNYSTSIETGVEKKSQEDVYKYIIEQLEGIISNNKLPETDNTGRVSLRAVYNLLAKTYLAYAWDKGVTATDDGIAEGQAATVTEEGKELFEQAADYADKAIGSGITMTSFSDMWNVKNDNNADIIFAIQYTRGISGNDESTEGNQQAAYFGNYYGQGVGYKYTTASYNPSLKLLYLFEPADDRFDGTFMKELAAQYYTFYSGFTDATAILGYYPAWYEDLSKLTDYPTSKSGREKTKVYSSSNPSVLVKAKTNRQGVVTGYTTGEQDYEVSQTGQGTSICVRKFDDYNAECNGTKAVSFHNIVLAHVTETYLLAAEAYYMAGDSEKALDYVNIVRDRSNAAKIEDWASYVRHYSDGTSKSYNSGSGIDNVPSITGSDLDPIDIILDERARELCGEYYRWMDLRRTKRLIDYNVKYNKSVSDASDFTGADGFNKWFRPIPNDAISLNDQVTLDQQNPGYGTN